MEVMFHSPEVKVDRWLCAGDSVGIFPYVNEVLEMQRLHQVTAVQGDHEQILLSNNIMEHSYSGNQALIAQRKVISEINREYLIGLPTTVEVSIDDLKILLTHYLVRDQSNAINEKYNFNLAQIDTDYGGYDFVIFGHTHLPAILYGKNVTALNPGSSGFPIDCIREPSYLLLDTVTGAFKLHRFKVDNSKLITGITVQKYNTKLIKYLENGYRWE